MATYISDGKKLLDVEYDVILDINDSIDGMRIIHKDDKSQDDTALFLLELGGNISCYIIDEEFLVGRVSGFKNLPEAIEAWNNGEI